MVDRNGQRCREFLQGLPWLSSYFKLQPTRSDVSCFASKCSLLGPLLTGESILVVVDYYSRFLEVVILKFATSTKIIEAITPMFAIFGVPFSLRTDNGPQFLSEEFESFLQGHGIEHRRTTPLWPQANGKVERQNRSWLKSLQIANFEGKDWRTELVAWLMAY